MKNLRTLLTVSIAVIFMTACGGESPSGSDSSGSEEKKEEPMKANPKGIGETQNIELTDPLQEDLVTTGKAIYEMKCSACHKLTDQRVVGPGWAGITNRRQPEWIMNMITNVDVMLEKDPEARKLLEECLTRMPNQGVATDDARAIVEYMRQNDLDQVGEKDKAVNT